ncbi:MAG: response regulator [Desulfobacteraceae bacterium]|nr:response regulator [Desulfobacteraceae bacterium]
MPTVLIVDDDETFRNLLKESLDEYGYTCRVAESAETARRVLRRNMVELILSDIHMPGESGLDFLEWALAENPGTAALVMTGNGISSETLSRTSRIGAYCCMAKPLALEPLLLNLADALHRAGRPSPEDFERGSG